MSQTSGEAPEIFFAGYRPEEFDTVTGAPTPSGEWALRQLARDVMKFSDVEVDEWIIVTTPEPAAETFAATIATRLAQTSTEAAVTLRPSAELGEMSDYASRVSLEYLLGQTKHKQDFGGKGIILVVNEAKARNYGHDRYGWAYADPDRIDAFFRQQPQDTYGHGTDFNLSVATGEDVYLSLSRDVQQAALQEEIAPEDAHLFERRSSTA